MKLILTDIGIALILLIAFTSCNDEFPEPELQFSDSLNIIIGNQYKVSDQDIAFYEKSSSSIYLKEHSISDFYELHSAKFWIADNKQAILEGICKGGWAECFDSTITTIMEEQNGGFILKLERSFYNKWISSNPVDERFNNKLLNAFEKYGKLHYGIRNELINLEQETHDESTFFNLSYKVTNLDTFDYFIINPEKIDLQHLLAYSYLLQFYDTSINGSQAITCGINGKEPDDKDRWKRDWLTILPSGGEKVFTLSLPFYSTIPPGEYNVVFDLPITRTQVRSYDDMFLDGTQVSLSTHYLREEFTIE